MLAEIYTEALLAKEDLDDQVWTLLDAGVIRGRLAVAPWVLLTTYRD